MNYLVTQTRVEQRQVDPASLPHLPTQRLKPRLAFSTAPPTPSTPGTRWHHYHIASCFCHLLFIDCHRLPSHG